MGRMHGVGALSAVALLVAVGLGTANANTEIGQQVYQSTCIACHGAGGGGAFPGTPDLTDVDGPLAKSDAELLRNIIDGFQSPGSPMAMPAKGGNPTLTEADVTAVIAYLRANFGQET